MVTSIRARAVRVAPVCQRFAFGILPRRSYRYPADERAQSPPPALDVTDDGLLLFFT
jgi:hypothetical protein